MKILMVGGKFDDNGGRQSSYFQQLADLFTARCELENPVTIINGGYWDNICANIKSPLSHFDVIIWMPDIPNDKSKIADYIKKNNPQVILVTSKRNENEKYDFMHLMMGALKVHSNLLIEFFTNKSGLICANLFDPLGNAYAINVQSISELALHLYTRIHALNNMTRIRSVRIGDKLDKAPDDPIFYGMIKKYALKYHALIHGSNPTRLMGNASFRCENGFPTHKAKNGMIFVSKRNIDKQDIGSDGFVAVEPSLKNKMFSSDKDELFYYGDDKPSVDAPIQVKLYEMYPNIEYMLHAHVYIDGAPFTKNVIPCGAMEEVQDILDACPNTNSTDFTVNLRGHGSILFMDTKALEKYEVDYFPHSNIFRIPYYARSFPEVQKNNDNQLKKYKSF